MKSKTDITSNHVVQPQIVQMELNLTQSKHEAISFQQFIDKKRKEELYRYAEQAISHLVGNR